MAEWTKAAKVGLFVLVVTGASIFIFRFVSRTTGTAKTRTFSTAPSAGGFLRAKRIGRRTRGSDRDGFAACHRM